MRRQPVQQAMATASPLIRRSLGDDLGSFAVLSAKLV
jgi:hypothetical protein